MALQHPFISGATPTKHALPDESEAQQQQKKQKKTVDGEAAKAPVGQARGPLKSGYDSFSSREL